MVTGGALCNKKSFSYLQITQRLLIKRSVCCWQVAVSLILFSRVYMNPVVIRLTLGPFKHFELTVIRNPTIPARNVKWDHISRKIVFLGCRFSSVRWAGAHMLHGWERPAQVWVRSAALCHMSPPFSLYPRFPVVSSLIYLWSWKRPKQKNVFLEGCAISALGKNSSDSTRSPGDRRLS